MPSIYYQPWAACCLCRIDQLRQEVAEAERRAAQVTTELKELNDTLCVKEKALEGKAAELDRCKTAECCSASMS